MSPDEEIGIERLYTHEPEEPIRHYRGFQDVGETWDHYLQRRAAWNRIKKHRERLYPFLKYPNVEIPTSGVFAQFEPPDAIPPF